VAGDEGKRGPEAAAVARVVHRAWAAKLINHATGSLNHGNLRQPGEPKRKLSPANCLLRPTDAMLRLTGSTQCVRTTTPRAHRGPHRRRLAPPPPLPAGAGGDDGGWGIVPALWSRLTRIILFNKLAKAWTLASSK